MEFKAETLMASILLQFRRLSIGVTVELWKNISYVEMHFPAML